jgi:hypothetical protein
MSLEWCTTVVHQLLLFGIRVDLSFKGEKIKHLTGLWHNRRFKSYGAAKTLEGQCRPESNSIYVKPC